MSQAPRIPGFAFVDRIGEGGFADVFRYTQDLPSRQVAIKVLRSSSDPAALDQFRAEANVMAQLSNHPSIVPIYQAGVSTDGRAYLVMEFCPPPHVAQRYRSQPLGVEEVLDVGVRISSAVETAHRAGILHRDIKPHNILTSSFGVPLLTDFGIASVAGESASSGQGLSVPWSPPESLSADVYDVRGDVYALAATLWSLLQGHSPFERREGPNDTASLIDRIERGQITALLRPDVPASLVSLLKRAMDRDVTRRPVSAMVLGRQLQDVQIELRRSPTRLEVMDASPEASDDVRSDDDRTLIRPVSVIVPSAVARPALKAPPPLAADPVGSVGPRAESASIDSARFHSAPPEREAPARSVAGRVIAAVVALAVVAGIGYALLPGDDEGPQRRESLRGEQPADPEELLNVPDPPTVVKSGKGTSWTFSWSVAQPQQGDRFKVVLTGDGIPPTAPEYLETTSRTVKIAPQATVCVQVSVSRDGGAASAPSPQVCAVGQ